MAEAGTRTVERALTLLAAVAEEGGTLSQLARAAELSPSTASRLLATLASQELVRRDEHGHYHAGAPAAAARRGDACAQDPLYELAGPHLERSGRRDRRDRQPGRRGRRPARRVPAPGRRARGWSRPRAGRGGRSRGAARRSARRCAGRSDQRGYVARAGAVEPDVTSIAAPVYGADGEIAAALSVLAPSVPHVGPSGSSAAGARWRATPRELSREPRAPSERRAA